MEEGGVRSFGKGRERECGMCPDERCGRGSGEVPWNLSQDEKKNIRPSK